MGVNDVINVAIIGAGAMAREHIRAFASVPAVKVNGIHSRTRAKAAALAAEFEIAHVCDSVADLYARTRADLVVVTVSEAALLSVGVACMAHEWALLLEKPPGMNPHETRELIHAAHTENRRAYVGLNRRFYSVTQAALADLAPNDGVRFIHVQDQQNLAAAAAQGFPPEVVAAWMYKNSIHLVDYFLTFGRGDVIDVQRILPYRGGTAPIMLARVLFSSGDHGLYEGVWDGPAPWAVSISTPAMRWELRPLEEATFQRRGERARHPVQAHADDVQFKAGFRAQAQQVIAALRGEPSQAVTLERALATMTLIEQIFADDVDDLNA